MLGGEQDGLKLEDIYVEVLSPPDADGCFKSALSYRRGEDAGYVGGWRFVLVFPFFVIGRFLGDE